MVIEQEGTWARRWARVRAVLSESVRRFVIEDSMTISASIAYYGLLSLFPFMLLLVSMAGLYIHERELGGQLAKVLEAYLPMKPDFIMRNLVAISRSFGRVGLASFLLLLWSSAGVFLPLEKALNRAWGVEEERRWWRSRLLALEMAMIFGFLILLSMGLVSSPIYVHKWIHRMGNIHAEQPVDVVYHILLNGLIFLVTLALFVTLFKRLPNRSMHLRQVLPSAFLTTILWEGARSLFTLLLPHFNYRQVYGSIGVVVGLMTWAYISSAVMLFGAQVSSALYRTLKQPSPLRNTEPAPEAVQSVGDSA